jgi:Tfp pilus assembly protein PilF
VAALGTCYLKNRLTKTAEDLLRPHLERRPQDTAARLVLARVFIREGELASAGEAMRVVLQAQPDNLMARYNLGFVDYRTGLYDEAVVHFKRTLELKPDHPEARYMLGLTYLAMGRLDEAIGALEQAVAQNPRHVGAHFSLANAYVRSGRLKEAETQQTLYAELSGRLKARTEKEVQIGSVSVKAIRYMFDHKYPEALAEYKSLAARFPDHAPLYKEIGRLQLRLGQRQEAFDSLRKAVEIDPKLSEPHYLLATLYRERGEAQAAEREMSIFAALETIPEGKSGY